MHKSHVLHFKEANIAYDIIAKKHDFKIIKVKEILAEISTGHWPGSYIYCSECFLGIITFKGVIVENNKRGVLTAKFKYDTDTWKFVMEDGVRDLLFLFIIAVDYCICNKMCLYRICKKKQTTSRSSKYLPEVNESYPCVLIMSFLGIFPF